MRLVHAQPYDPQARGKMERFWRTCRERCLDHLPATATLHDVQLRLYAFLDEWYHRAPHAGLIGQTPAQRWATRELPAVDEQRLRDALVVRTTRRVSNDGVLSVGGRLWEVSAGFLAGCRVVVERSLATPDAEPPKKGAAVDLIPFDPMQPLVDASIGRVTMPRGER